MILKYKNREQLKFAQDYYVNAWPTRSAIKKSKISLRADNALWELQEILLKNAGAYYYNKYYNFYANNKRAK